MRQSVHTAVVGRWGRGTIGLFLVMAIGLCAPARGQEPAKPRALRAEEPLQLSLEQAVRTAVLRNLRLQGARLNLDTARLGVSTAVAAFSPTLSLSLTRSGSESSVRTGPTSKTTLSTTFGPSITNRFITGTSVTLAQSNTRADATLGSGNKLAGLSLTVTQPLLKGAGIEVNVAPIETARLSALIAVLDLEARLADLVTSVEGAYLDYLLALEDLKIRALALENAKRQREINKFLIDVGRLPARELASADSAVSTAEVEVAVSRNSLETAKRQLLRLLSLDPMDVVLTDPLAFKPVVVDPVAALETARRRRPELLRARQVVESARINVNTSANGTLYDLSLNANVSSNGATLDPLTKAWVWMSDFKDFTWSLGATLTIPFDNAPNRNALIAAINTLRQAELDLKDNEQALEVDLDTSIKTLAINATRVMQAERGKTLAEERLETETLKFREGRATNSDIINARRDLVTAQNDLLQAIVSYEKIRSTLEFVQGTALDRWQIEVK